MPTTLTTSSWLFPPRASEVQLDEAWSFVAKKQKNCDPADPADDHKRDWWDHVAYDAEHKLVLAVVPGARVGECAQEVVEEVKDRLGDRPPALFTSDEHAAYETASSRRSVRPSRRPRVRGAPAARGCRPGGGPPPDWPMRRCARSERRAGSPPSAGRWSWGTSGRWRRS